MLLQLHSLDRTNHNNNEVNNDKISIAPLVVACALRTCCAMEVLLLLLFLKYHGRLLKADAVKPDV